MREEEKSRQDFEALHSSLISLDESDEEQETLMTRTLVWRAEEVPTIFKVWTWATKKDYQTSRGGSV